MFDWLNVEKEFPLDLSNLREERIDVDYRLWLRQKNEITTLKFLVGMQMIGIVALAVAVALLMIGWY